MPATAIPERFARSWFDRGGSRKAEEAEYEVYAAICEGLDETWSVAPATELHVARYRGHVDETELDLVLFHEDHGIVLLEVKSWEQVQVRGGRFVLEGEQAATKDPVKQLQRHRNLLGEVIDSVLGADDGSGRLAISFGLALPKLRDGSEQGIADDDLPQGWSRPMLLGPGQLSVDQVASSVLGLLGSAPRKLDAEQLRVVMADLFPNQQFDYSPQGIIQMRRRREALAVRSELEVLETLDQNRRVLVTGRAGSGKSLLLTKWAQRALGRGEQVLVTCKGRPNAELLRGQLGVHPALTVAPFLDHLAEQPELPANPFGPSEAEASDVDGYWTEADRIFQEHYGRLGLRYDTVIVDEIQDLEPWARPVLEHLVSANPKGKVLAVGDLRQSMGFEPRDLDATYGAWARASLTRNHRSPVEVQLLLEMVAEDSVGRSDFEAVDPTGEVACFVEVPSPVEDPGAWHRAVIHALEERCAFYDQEMQVPSDQIAVLTTSKRDQEDLVAYYSASGWDNHIAGTELIETVNKVKGAEFQAVILIPNHAKGSPLRPQLLSGMGRATAFLSVISPDPLLGGPDAAS